MPSTLYESVKQSIAEYTQLKKRNERTEDKLLFRWKLITLTLAIIFIVLVGVFSQFLKNIGNLPDVQGDKSYIVPLMASISPISLSTLSDAQHLLQGISVTSDADNEYFQWNSIQLLYSSAAQRQIVYTDLISKIQNTQRLLMVFSNVYNDSYTARAGMYAHEGFSSTNNNTDNKYSSMFNILTGATLQYNAAGCSLFSTNGTTITFFNSITVVNATSISVNVTNSNCFGSSNITSAQNTLSAVTGLTITTWPQIISNTGLEIFRLYLNEDI